MSFVSAAPEIVTATAADLAEIGSTLRQTLFASAVPTTSVAPAAIDEVSLAFSQLFGGYGREFQALSARAAAFHDEFVNLISAGATAYLGADLANTQRGLAADTPLLGGSLGAIVGGGSLGLVFTSGGGGILGGLSVAFSGLSSAIASGPLGPIFAGTGQGIGVVVSGFVNAVVNSDPRLLLSGWYGSGTTTTATGGAWQTLFANTGANLQNIFNAWSANPFPALRQVIANQQGYAQLIASAWINAATDFPGGLPVLQGQVQAAIQSANGFNPLGFVEWYTARQLAYGETGATALTNALQAMQTTLPTFEHDLAMVGQSVMTGNYHTAVQYIPRAAVDLLVSGVDIHNLSSVEVQGPAGALLPALSIASGEEQDNLGLLPQGSTVQHMAQNLVNGLTASATTLGLAIIGPPIATLDGLASGATALGAAVQTGNPAAIAGALVDLPAYTLNGFLNGNTIVDVTVPVTETVSLTIPPLGSVTIGANTPVVIHLPFEGILAPPQPISATLEVTSGVTTVPVTVTISEIQAAGLVPALLTYGPEQVASAIAPNS